MTALSLGLILLSAVGHATWNLLAKRVGGGALSVWTYSALAALIYAPLAVFVLASNTKPLGIESLVAMLISGVLHTGYFLLLQRGYRDGDLSLVYPLARGTGPTLSTLAAIALFGERPSPVSLAGAVLIGVGVFLLAGAGARAGAARRSAHTLRLAIGYGLATGVFIAIYTLWDKRGVSAVGVPPLVFDWGTGLTRALLLTPLALPRWAEVKRNFAAHRRAYLGIALLAPAAYILVLTALSTTAVSYVAPAREISILIGTFFGVRALKEGDGRRRLVAAALMVVGIMALALG
ncbi:MAG: DMT family transporter [Thermoflexales bacterium]|nr:DMT family transporter [Thermoflexales bacterium]